MFPSCPGRFSFVFSAFAGPLVFGILLASTGCTDTKTESGPASGSQAAAQEDPAALAAVETLKGKVTRDADGFVIDVDLRGTAADDESLPVLAPLTRLRSLHLDELPITDAGIASLKSFKGPLASLDLRDCALTNAAMEHLAGIKSLRAIRLSGANGKTSVDDTGIAFLATLPSLKVLAADELFVSTAGLEALKGVGSLEELYLKSTLVDDDSMLIAAGFPNLKKLRISKTQVSNDGLKHLTACRKLEDIDLSENSLLNDDGMIHVGAITSLKRLNLWRVSVSDSGTAKLASLTNLEWLNLDNTQLSDAGLPALKDMTRLTFLHLGSTSISDTGLPLLEHLTSLKDLKVTRTAVTEAGVAELKKKLVNTEIQLKYVENL